MSARPHRLGVVAAAAVAACATLVAAEQTESGRQPSDGLVRSELSLGGRTATLAFTPTLGVNDAAHAALLSATPRAGSGRVRIGHLEATGALRIGPVDLGPRAPDASAKPPSEAAAAPSGPVASRHDLWLEGAADGWQLQVLNSANAVVGQVPLQRHSATPASSTLVASLVPEDTASSRLVLRWGGYVATTDVTFVNPLRRRPDENRVPNETVNRRHDEDTSALSRARLLAQRNETALVLANGTRLSLSFQRTLARGERVEGNPSSRGLRVDGPDFARLMTTSSGAIVMLSEAPVPRLRIERPLIFGKTRLAVGNQVAGFPGSYGVWLRRAANGWRFVFSHEPDVWGSQHNPKFDAGEVELAYSSGGAAGRPFAMALVPTAADRGQLVLKWGPHEWTAEFSVAR